MKPVDQTRSGIYGASNDPICGISGAVEALQLFPLLLLLMVLMLLLRLLLKVKKLTFFLFFQLQVQAVIFSSLLLQQYLWKVLSRGAVAVCACSPVEPLEMASVASERVLSHTMSL